MKVFIYLPQSDGWHACYCGVLRWILMVREVADWWKALPPYQGVTAGAEALMNYAHWSSEEPETGLLMPRWNLRTGEEYLQALCQPFQHLPCSECIYMDRK